MGLVITGYCGVKNYKWIKKYKDWTRPEKICPSMTVQHHDLDAVSGQNILKTTKVYQDKTNANVVS